MVGVVATVSVAVAADVGVDAAGGVVGSVEV